MAFPLGLASAGLDLIGGALGSSASKKAAAKQKRAAEQAGALQREQYYTSLGMNSPYYLTGTGANNLQAQMWGLPYQNVQSPMDIANSYVGSSTQLSAKNVIKMLKKGMSINEIAKFGTINPTKKGMNKLIKYGITADQFNTLRRGPQGQVEAPAIQNAPGAGGAQGGAPAPNFDAFYNTPAYQWNLKQGLGAVQNSAAARGGLFSGNAARELQKTGSGLASNEFWNVQNFLSSLSNRGQNAAGQNQQAGQFYATGGGNALGARGEADAAGTLGAAASWQNALSSAASGLGSRVSGVAPSSGGSGGYGGLPSGYFDLSKMPWRTPPYNPGY